jgi:hypothetical protein
MNDMILLNSFSDERGGLLIPLEFNKIKFIPKRIFTIIDVPKNNIRGEHAHYNIEQLLICIKGKIEVYLDDGKNVKVSILQQGDCIYIDKYIWGQQKFLTGNDVLLVLASHEYNKEDYITDKKEFYKIVGKKNAHK